MLQRSDKVRLKRKDSMAIYQDWIDPICTLSIEAGQRIMAFYVTGEHETQIKEDQSPVTDADIQAEYDKFVAANSGKEYRARHILVEKEEQAKAIIARLKKGAKFEDIAKKQSKDPGSGANGGDLDWAAAASYVPEFSEAMVKLDKGQLTQDPVKTQFGWHVIRVDDVRSAELPKLEDIKPQIAQQMQQQKLADFQKTLRDKAKVE